MENQGNKRGKTMFSFFKTNEQASTSKGHSPSNVDVSNRSEQPPFKSQRVKLMLILLNKIMGYEFQCGNILLINKMKLEEFISK